MLNRSNQKPTPHPPLNQNSRQIGPTRTTEDKNWITTMRA
jgi:hypothetical protein